MKSERLIRVVIGLFLLIVFVAPLFSGGIDLLVDWLWFKHLGYEIIYLTVLKGRIAVSTLAGFAFIIFVAINLLIARRFAHKSAYRIHGEIIEFPGLDKFTSLFRGLVWFAVLVIAYFAGDWASDHWLDYLLFMHPVHVGKADPLFGIDISFYLFRLPFIWFLFHLALLIILMCLLLLAVYYFLEGGVQVTPKTIIISRSARAHLMLVGAAFMLLMAYRARLAMYGLLFSPRGLIYGAGYTDVHATLPVMYIILVLCVITAIAFALGAQSGRLRAPALSLGLLIVVAIIGAGLYPALIQQYIVTPNEIDKERPYIARAIEYTRKAYALDRFTERTFSNIQDLTLNTIGQNTATMRNIRLWDHKPLRTTFAQLQEIRTYYTFANVDNDRYWINGVYRQVSLSPRELSEANLPQRNWINEHLTYTHGYGVCMSPVNESTPDGLPQLFIKNIPPVSTIPLQIKRPGIYFGELPNDYCFVKTNALEFDYPSGNQNVYTNYQGDGGIPVDNVWRRLLFALHFGEVNILLSSDIQPTSRMMIYRQIIDRATRLAPFLTFDGDPYMVIADDGSLHWILDAYTTSSQYPYSNPTPNLGFNYIRNAVKVTIDAYDGTVQFYISDPTDPIVQAYARLFPGVFHPLRAMPTDLKAHIRYPEDFFSIQASQYAVFHMTDPRVFYSKEDLWRVAQSAAHGTIAPMAPYYTIMKLAEVGTQEEFILMVPFTPARKDNMIAWMAARCDAPNYGKVLVFTFPKEKLAYGPQQIEARIDQVPAISQQLTLWNQGGSSVIRGTLLVIPVKNSVLYVEPLYLAAQAGGALPQLKRVIVAYSDKVVMEPSLDEALSTIFGGNVETGPGPAGGAPSATPAAAGPAGKISPTFQQLINEANQDYQKALQAQRQGDWAGYGAEIKKLGDILNQLIKK
ncbi:MAG: UPF0182 family protein [Terriglobia bacterium]